MTSNLGKHLGNKIDTADDRLLTHLNHQTYQVCDDLVLDVARMVVGAGEEFQAEYEMRNLLLDSLERSR